MFLLLMSATMLLVTSCSKDENLTEGYEGLALAQVEMTYEQILKGYTPEEIAAPKDEMTPTTEPETIADDELKRLLQETRDSSYSKTNTRVESARSLLPFMGVFKVSTCGNYKEVKVSMDCEDGGFTNINDKLVESKIPGTWVDGNRNVIMTFCVVMNDQAYMIPKGYGALYFVGGQASLIAENAKRLIEEPNLIDPNSKENTPRMTFVERYHDNEDSDNMNTAVFNGITLGDKSVEFGDNYGSFTPRPSFFGKGVPNILLTWMFPRFNPIKPFHPGFSYGVLYDNGPVAGADAVLRIDDENKKNKNEVYNVEWHIGGGYNRSKHNSNYYNGIVAEQNTTYYLKIIN